MLATRSDSRRVVPKASEVYCEPRSEWWTTPAGGLRRVTAIPSASTTNSEIVAHRPADDAAAVGVEYDREKQPALTGRQVGDVGEPQLVRPSGGEAATDEVRRRRRSGIGDRGTAPLPAPRDAFQLELAHQAGDAL